MRDKLKAKDREIQSLTLALTDKKTLESRLIKA
jgi:hypothetical protein